MTNFLIFQNLVCSTCISELQSKRTQAWQSPRNPPWIIKMKICWRWDVCCIREGCSKLPC